MTTIWVNMHFIQHDIKQGQGSIFVYELTYCKNILAWLHLIFFPTTRHCKHNQYPSFHVDSTTQVYKRICLPNSDILIFRLVAPDSGRNPAVKIISQYKRTLEEQLTIPLGSESHTYSLFPPGRKACSLKKLKLQS